MFFQGNTVHAMALNSSSHYVYQKAIVKILRHFVTILMTTTRGQYYLVFVVICLVLYVSNTLFKEPLVYYAAFGPL